MPFPGQAYLCPTLQTEIMTRILHCLTFIFGVLLLSCPASAQPAAGGKVVFEVTDSLHTPLAYATIALKAHADGKM